MKKLRNWLLAALATLVAFSGATVTAPAAQADPWNYGQIAVFAPVYDCLATNGTWDVNRDYARVYAYDCVASWADQHWTYFSNNRLYNHGTDMCLGIQDNYWAVQRWCTHAPEVLFIPVNGYSGRYQIKRAGWNQCLAIRSGDGYTNGEQGIWASCNYRYTDQHWGWIE